MGFYELLKNRHDELSAPILAQKREKQGFRGDLRDLKKSRMLASQVLTLNWEKEKARACGDDVAADQYEQEIAKVNEEIQRRSDEVQQLAEEIAQIDAELKAVAEKVLNEVFPQLREVAQEYWVDALNVSTSIWEALQKYAAETGARASVHQHKRRLIPEKHGVTRPVRKRLIEWTA